MIEVYRGSANTWECDEMGHMNVRFYVSRMMEGLMEFAHVSGMPSAFRAGAPSTLRPRDQHIRYKKEARAGEPFSMQAGVLDIRESSVLLYQQIDHANADICAALHTWIDHIDIDSGKPFSWSPRTLASFEAHRIEPASVMAPRTLSIAQSPAVSAEMSEADSARARTIGRGVVLPQHCDLFGIMAPEHFVGRVSDSIGHLLGDWRETVALAASDGGEPIEAGGAVLESRWVYRKWPKAGDRFVIRTALGDVTEKTHTFIHWVLNPDTGHAWATNQTVAITFDLKKRAIVSTTSAAQDALRAIVPPGLFL